MKAKINPSGTLEIKRAGKYKECCCPAVSESLELTTCGDWCPLFGEPLPVIDKIINFGGQPTFTDNGKVSISLCKKELIFDEFEDLR